MARSISSSAAGTLFIGSEATKAGNLSGQLPADLGHAVVGDAARTPATGPDRPSIRARQRQRQHLLHVGQFLASIFDARLDVPEHAEAGHALDDAGVLGVLLERSR